MQYELLDRVDQFDMAMYFVAAFCAYLSLHFGRLALNCIQHLQKPGFLDDFDSLMMTSKIEVMRGKVSRRIIASTIVTPIPVICSLLEMHFGFTLFIYAVSSIILISCVVYNYSSYRNVAKFYGKVSNEKNQLQARERKLDKIKQASGEGRT